jgi:hypothetical protein
LHLIENTIVSVKFEGKDKDPTGTKDSSRKDLCDESKGMSGNWTSAEGSVSRSDANIFILAMLYRIIHRLLLLDPLFSKWQVSAQYHLTLPQGGPPVPLSRDGDPLNESSQRQDIREPLTFPPRQFKAVERIEPSLVKGRWGGTEGTVKAEAPAENIAAPPGIVLTCINLSNFIQDSLDIVTYVSKMSDGSSSAAVSGEGGYIGETRPVQVYHFITYFCSSWSSICLVITY